MLPVCSLVNRCRLGRLKRGPYTAKKKKRIQARSDICSGPKIDVRRYLEGATFGTVLTKEGVKELFDDMVEAQFWVSALTIYCSEDQRQRVNDVSRDINRTVEEFVSGESMGRAAIAAILERGDKKERSHTTSRSAHGVWGAAFSDWYETILACARDDIGESYAE